MLYKWHRKVSKQPLNQDIGDQVQDPGARACLRWQMHVKDVAFPSAFLDLIFLIIKKSRMWRCRMLGKT